MYYGMRGRPVTDLVKQVAGRCPLLGAEVVNVHLQRELDDTGGGAGTPLCNAAPVP